MIRHFSFPEKENIRFVRSSLYASDAAKLMLEAIICCLSFRASESGLVPLLSFFVPFAMFSPSQSETDAAAVFLPGFFVFDLTPVLLPVLLPVFAADLFWADVPEA